MVRGFGLRHTVLSLSVLALLSGCGGPGVTENPMPTTSGNGGTGTPSAGQPGTGQPGPAQPDPGLPGTGTNPAATAPTNPSPPSEAIGEASTATANPAVLTSTTTTIYPLNSSILGSGGWRPTALLETANVSAGTPRVAFDVSGNGLAAWTQGGDMVVRRYIASTGTWLAPVVLDTRSEQAHYAHLAVDRQSGNAVATWTQSDGTAESVYASRFNASTDTWSAAQLLESTNGALDPYFDYYAVSIRGEHAAVAWSQGDGTATNVYLSRLVNGSWTAPAVVDTHPTNSALDAHVAIDANGNTAVVWRQFLDDGEGGRILTRRWDNTALAFGAVTALDADGDRQPRLAFDAQGNGFAVWRGGGVFVRRFDVTSGTWGPQMSLHNGTGSIGDAELAVDADGNAVVMWIENDGVANSVYARRYSSFFGTWSNAALLENSNVPASVDRYPTVSMHGNDAVVAWIEEGTRVDAYAAKMTDGTWGPATPLETRDEPTNELTSAVDAAGSATVAWVQADGMAPSIYQARYQSSNYVVPNGATWQSLANTLYGVNSVQAGNALQAALGGGALTGGMILSGLPATLSVTTPIPAYYTVLATDTWSHIAQTVYGVTDTAAIAQLRTLLGNPTLVAGMQLVVPTIIGYTTSGNYSAPLDWDLVNTTATTYHALNTAALTVPLNNWSAAQLLETSSEPANSPRVAFDANSNGIAVWVQGSDVIARRYIASSATWSAPVVLDTNPAAALTPRLAIDRTTGDAVVSWVQSDGAASSIYVSSFDAGTNSWSVAMLLETSNNAVYTELPENSAVAKAGDHAAVAWLQAAGTTINVYLSRLVSGTWTAPALVDTATNPAAHPEVAIDSNGNTTVVWRQFLTDDEGGRIASRRWDNTALAFGPVIALDGDGDRQPRLAFDAQGNGFALWRGGGVYVRRFDVSTGVWGAQVQVSGPNPSTSGSEISVDASGDALATWVEYDGTTNSVYARYYDAATASWGAAVLLENSNVPVSTDFPMTVTLVNGSGVVAWLEEGTRNVYAARLGNGVWGSATLLETADEGASELASSIDAASNATVLWVQPNWISSIFQARSNGTPYYLVPAAATWQSLANTLYGVDSVAAGQALQTAMGNPTLTTGLHLQLLPAQLVVTPAVPTYYVVHSGDTWASITLALYGTNAVEAAAALQTVLGNPSLTVGSWLLIPSTLNYTVDED